MSPLQGVVEVKCMPSINGAVEDQIGKKSSLCLVKSASGEVQLSQSHAYFYQIQGQLKICGVIL